jgi:hypothetical protein
VAKSKTYTKTLLNTLAESCRLTISITFLLFIILLSCASANAQNQPFPPPNQLQVYSMQELSFGSFSTGVSGGTVIINPSGFRSSTGSVILLGSGFYPAIFDIRLVPGRMVQITLGQVAQLQRLGGGGSMTMQIGPTDKGSSFVTSGGHPFRNPVAIGGTLNVGSDAANPPGEYQGYFYVTFNQE